MDLPLGVERSARRVRKTNDGRTNNTSHGRVCWRQGRNMHLIEDQTKQNELTRMKRLATGLLVAVALIFIITLRLQRQYPWVNFIRATAEAAMVGAFADWFAVIALFRHPLGLP